jgi:hypothetical protein
MIAQLVRGLPPSGAPSWGPIRDPRLHSHEILPSTVSISIPISKRNAHCLGSLTVPDRVGSGDGAGLGAALCICTCTSYFHLASCICRLPFGPFHSTSHIWGCNQSWELARAPGDIADSRLLVCTGELVAILSRQPSHLRSTSFGSPPPRPHPAASAPPCHKYSG